MAQEERLEIIAKLDESGKQVVSAQERSVSAATPISPAVPVDATRTLKSDLTGAFETASSKSADAISGSILGLAGASLASAITAAALREAQLRILKEINASIKKLDADVIKPPTPAVPPTPRDPQDFNPLQFSNTQFRNEAGPPNFGRGARGALVPFQPPGGMATVPPPPPRSPPPPVVLPPPPPYQPPSPGQPPLNLAWAFFVVRLRGLATEAAKAAAALTGLIVSVQLYSSALTAFLEASGKLSADLKQAQAESELIYLRQQMQFAEDYGTTFAEMERNRSDMNEQMRLFRAEVTVGLSGGANLISNLAETFFALLNSIMAMLRPVTILLNSILAVINNSLEQLTLLVKLSNPLNWFKWGNDGLDVWRDLTNPDNMDLDNPPRVRAVGAQFQGNPQNLDEFRDVLDKQLR